MIAPPKKHQLYHAKLILLSFKVPLAFSFEGKLLPPAHFSSIRLPKTDIAPPFWYPGQPFGHLGPTLEDHGRSRKGTREVQNQIFIDFGSILGLCFDVVWALRLEICICFRARFQVTYCTDFLGRNLDARGSYNTFVWPKTHFHRQQHRTNDC